MADEVVGVGLDGVGETLSLESLSDPADLNRDISVSMSEAMEGAINNIGSDPLIHRTGPDELGEISGRVKGEVEDLVESMRSNASRTDSGEVTPNEESVMDAAHEVASVVQDLTRWQITWGVAQTAQKDLSHILKSG